MLSILSHEHPSPAVITWSFLLPTETRKAQRKFAVVHLSLRLSPKPANPERVTDEDLNSTNFIKYSINLDVQGLGVALSSQIFFCHFRSLRFIWCDRLILQFTWGVNNRRNFIELVGDSENPIDKISERRLDCNQSENPFQLQKAETENIEYPSS
jgi:hypothetical protein